MDGLNREGLSLAMRRLLMRWWSVRSITVLFTDGDWLRWENTKRQDGLVLTLTFEQLRAVLHGG